jgi:hypothetical protein
MSDGSWARYEVWLHSKPGPGFEYYEGCVKVWAEGIQEAKERALGQLRRGAFPERSRESWVIDKVVAV